MGEPQKQHNQQREQKQLVITSEKVEPSPFGLWDPSQIQVQHLPAFFPRNKLQWERFPLEDLPIVLDRISSRLLSASSDNGDDERYIVRASPTDEPLSAKITAVRGDVELYLVFFRENDGTVSMSVQRLKGDHMVANVYVRRLVDIAKGLDVDADDYDDHSEGNNDDDDNFLRRMNPDDNAIMKFNDACQNFNHSSSLLQDESQQLRTLCL